MSGNLKFTSNPKSFTFSQVENLSLKKKVIAVKQSYQNLMIGLLKSWALLGKEFKIGNCTFMENLTKI